MRIFKLVCGVVCSAVVLSCPAPQAHAAEVYPLITSTQPGTPTFVPGGAAITGRSGYEDTPGVFYYNYTHDNNAVLDGNQVFSINQNHNYPCCHGTTIQINISNGENGVNSTNDPGGVTNVDIPNIEPAHPVFAAIGNPSGKLENGNVLRFSAWFRSDPANPITIDPQVQPILKFEFWKEALSTNQHADGATLAPLYGDRVFDQDQQGVPAEIPDKPHWVDIDGDGVVLGSYATVGNGLITTLSADEWRLAEVVYTVDTNFWLGVGPTAFGENDVTVIEEIRAVMFLGDFLGGDFTGDGPDGGNLLVDNLLVEVFRDAGSVTPNLNPNPSLPDVELIGDYNGDNVVDAADYTVWRNNLDTDFALPNRDPDNTGLVSVADYDSWKANYGTSLGPGGGGISTSVVPEPASLFMASLTLLGCIVVRRRK